LRFEEPLSELIGFPSAAEAAFNPRCYGPAEAGPLPRTIFSSMAPATNQFISV
jgi:hypothetical protein